MSGQQDLETPPPEPTTIYELSRANCGRIRNFRLTDKTDNEVDRDVGDQIVCECTIFQQSARAARLFLVRAVQHLAAECGVGQFVELGSGYPCPPNLHEVARSMVPAARTLYLDPDPVIVAHGQAFLEDEHQAFVHADLTDASIVVQQIIKNVNLAEPVAICLGFVAEFIRNPRTVVKAVSAVLPPGSYVILSHVTSDVDAEEVTRAAAVYQGYGIGFWPRPRDEIEGILSDCDLIEPGLVASNKWRPDSQVDAVHGAVLGWDPAAIGEICLAAVGRVR